MCNRISSQTPGVQAGVQAFGASPQTPVSQEQKQLEALRNVVLRSFSHTGKDAGQSAISDAQVRGQANLLGNVAGDLARMPLTGPAAEPAKEAEPLFQNMMNGELPIRENIAQFQELRAKALTAVGENDGDTRAFFDAMNEVLLVAPLTDALAKGGLKLGGNRNQALDVTFTQALYGQVKMLLEAQNDSELQAATAQLKSSQILFQENGLNSSEVKEAFDLLDGLGGLKKNAFSMLGEITSAVTAQKEERAVETMAATMSRLEGLCVTFQEITEIPGQDIALSPLAKEVEGQMTQLKALSEKRSTPVQENMKREHEAIRAINHKNTDCAKEPVGLEKRLPGYEQQLLSRDIARLESKMAAMEKSYAASKLIEEYRWLEKKNISADDLGKKINDFCLKADELGQKNLSREDVIRLDATRVSLEGSLTRMEREAARPFEANIGSFEKRLAQAKHTEDFDSLLADVEKYKKESGLMDVKGLRQVRKDEFMNRLEKLADGCVLGRFEALFSLCHSTRVDAPSMQDIFKNVTEKKEGVSAEIQEKWINRMETESSSTKSKLHENLNKLVVSLKSFSNIQEFRSLQTEFLRMSHQADRWLLADDARDFKASVDNARKDLAEPLLAAIKEKNPDFARTLNESQTETLKTLSRESWGNVSLFQALAALPEDELKAGLDDLKTAFDSPGDINSNAVAFLDKLTLEKPELDNLALVLKEKCVDPGLHNRLEILHESTRANREIGRLLHLVFSAPEQEKLGLAAPDLKVDSKLLSLLVNGAAAGAAIGAKNVPAKSLGELDLALIGAFWLARQTEEPNSGTFAAFQERLPEPYRDIKNLESLVLGGAQSRKHAQRIADSIVSGSKAFGNNQKMLQICQTLVQGEETFAARKALTTLARNYLDGHSFTGEQAMAGKATALENALQRKLDGEPSIVESFVDRGKEFLTQKDLSARGNYEEQLTAFAAQSSEVLTAVGELEKLAAEEEEAKGVLETRANELQEALKDIDQNGKKIQGATLSLSMLAMLDVLENENSDEDAQTAMKGIQLQSNINIGKMRGSKAINMAKGVKSDDLAKEFKTLKKNLEENWSPENKKAMFDFFAEHKLASKAKVVLSLKKNEQNSGVAVIESALKHMKVDINSELGTRMKKQYVSLAGQGAKLQESIKLAESEVHKKLEEATKKLKTAQKAFSGRVQTILEDATAMGVLSTFLDSDKSGSAELIQEMDPLQGKFKDWPFYADCKKKLENLGIKGELADVQLQKFFLEMKNEGKTFSDLAASTHRNIPLVFKDLSIRFNTPKEMEEVIKTAQVTETAKNLLESIKPGEQMVLDITSEVGCNIPVVRTASAEVDLNLSAGLEKGMVVWRDQDTNLHVAFSKGASVGIGATAEVLEGVVSVAGQVEGGVGKGCMLTLKKEKEGEFLTSVLMGTVPPKERAMEFMSEHCSEVKQLKIQEVEGRISVGVNVLGSSDTVGEYLGFGASAKMTGNKKWETTENRQGKTLTITSDCSMSLAVNLEAKVNMNDDDKASAMSKQATSLGMEFEKDIVEQSFQHIEERTTSPDGKTLQEFSRSGVFKPGSASKVQAVLEEQSVPVPQEIIRDILEDLDGNEKDFSLEVVQTLKPDALERYNAAGDLAAKEKILSEPENFSLTVKLEVQIDSAQDSMEFNGCKLVNFSHRQHASHSVSTWYDSRLLPLGREAA